MDVKIQKSLEKKYGEANVSFTTEANSRGIKETKSGSVKIIVTAKEITEEDKKTIEEEKEKIENNQNYKDAYKHVPAANATYTEIANFIGSCTINNKKEVLESVSNNTLEQWKKPLETTRDNDATLRNRCSTYLDALNEIIEDGKISDTTFNKMKELANASAEASQKTANDAEKKINKILGNFELDEGTTRATNKFQSDVTSDTNNYKPSDIDSKSATKIETATSKVLTVVSNIGIAISVIVLAILGVKYMLGSVEEKAEYKQDLIPYVIGALILFGITGFVKILMIIGEKISS